jgi:hypothetical protein
MSRDSLNTLIRLALILSLASSLIGLAVGLLSEEENRKDDKKDLETATKLRAELNEIHKEINQLKAQICNGH